MKTLKEVPDDKLPWKNLSSICDLCGNKFAKHMGRNCFVHESKHFSKYVDEEDTIKIIKRKNIRFRGPIV